VGSLGVTNSACSPWSEGMAESNEADDHKITKPAVAAGTVPLPADRAWPCQWGKTLATRSCSREHSIITITLLRPGMLQQ
jgi:hypothetical protein